MTETGPQACAVPLTPAEEAARWQAAKQLRQQRPAWLVIWLARTGQPGGAQWQLGSLNGTTFSWMLAATTAGFGNTAGDPTWTGDFTGSGRSEVLFYSPGDQNWWLGTFSGTALGWTFAGNTSGFGNTVGDPTWTGDFTGNGHRDMLFYSPGDTHWFLGQMSNGQLSWSLVAKIGV